MSGTSFVIHIYAETSFGAGPWLSSRFHQDGHGRISVKIKKRSSMDYKETLVSTHRNESNQGARGPMHHI